MEEILAAEKGDLSRICKLLNIVSKYGNFEVRMTFSVNSRLAFFNMLNCREFFIQSAAKMFRYALQLP